jgi:hypothetical protein
MKRILTFLILSCFAFPLWGQEVNLKKGLVASFPFDGGTADITGTHKNGKASNVKTTDGRDGKQGGAYRFKLRDDSYINLPVDAGPDKMPVVTITAWLRPQKSFTGNPVIS